MHKQSFAECHSLATKAPFDSPIHVIFRLKFPKVSKKNFWSFQLKPQEFKQKTPRDFNCKSWGLFSYNPDYTINAATSAKIA